jgi:hypothetical protein
MQILNLRFLFDFNFDKQFLFTFSDKTQLKIGQSINLQFM